MSVKISINQSKMGLKIGLIISITRFVHLSSKTNCSDVHYIKLFSPQYVDELYAEVKANEKLLQSSDLYLKVQNSLESKAMESFHIYQLGLEKDWIAIRRFYLDIVLSDHRLYASMPMPLPKDGIFLITKQHSKSETSYIETDEFLYLYKVYLPLNNDFEGGGTKFINKKCPDTIPDPPYKGNMLVYPGRLTHLSHSLPITHGTKYGFTMFSCILRTKPYEKHGAYELPGHVLAPVFDSTRELRLEFLVDMEYISENDIGPKNITV